MSRRDDEDARLSLFGPGTATKLPGAVTSSDIAGGPEPLKTAWDGDDLDDPARVAFDRVWQLLLGQLLGRLEHGRAALDRRHPAAAVGIAAAMVGDVADVLATHVDPVKFARPIAEARAAAGRFVTAAEVAAARPGRGFRGWFAKAEPPAALQECSWVLRDLPAVLERYFVLLGSCFRAVTPRADWLDTSILFVGELRRSLGAFES